MKQLDNNNPPGNKSTNEIQRQIRFHFLIEITLGIILLGSTCLLTGVLGIGEYYLKDKWITGGTEIVAIIAVLLAFSILGIIFFIKGVERLSAGAFTYIFNLIRNFRWDELFNYQKKVFLYARKIVKREPIQQEAIPVVPKPVEGESKEAKRERFITVVNIIMDKYIQDWSNDAIKIRKESRLFSGPLKLRRKFMLLIQPVWRWLKTKLHQPTQHASKSIPDSFTKFENEDKKIENAINESAQKHLDEMIDNIDITIKKFGYSSLYDKNWDELVILLKPDISEGTKSRTKYFIKRLAVLFGIFIALVIVLPLSFFIEIILLPIAMLMLGWDWLNEDEESEVLAVANRLRQRKSKAVKFILKGAGHGPKNTVEISNTKQPLKAFLCHSRDDAPKIRELYKLLSKDGVNPWLDVERLLPGDNWPEEIYRAVQHSDVVIICFSKGTATKEGFVQREIKWALEVAEEKPDGTIFLIPLKLEECDIPERLHKLQWVNLFDENGYDLLKRSLSRRAEAKSKN